MLNVNILCTKDFSRAEVLRWEAGILLLGRGPPKAVDCTVHARNGPPTFVFVILSGRFSKKQGYPSVKTKWVIGADRTNNFFLFSFK